MKIITNQTVKVTLILNILLFLSCKQQGKQQENVTESKPEIKEKVVDITIEKLTESPSYSDASLLLDTPKIIESKTSDEMEFSFTLHNYELGVLTKSQNIERLANSAKGQHIHFILNNEPYSAHYESTFKKKIPDGVHHLVAFLSRSYHESVKNDSSVVVKKLVIGENPKDTYNLDMNAPTLVYSRPKGEYKGKDTEQVLLDFFVLNTELSENGPKVRATINGKEFMISKWAPHVMKGLPKGEVTIQLELIDEAGNLIPGPFNKVTRTIQIKE